MSSPVPNNELTRFQAGKEQVEIARQGGIASGIARKRNAIIKDSLKKILSSGVKIPTEIKDDGLKLLINSLKSLGVDTNNLTLPDLINLGQILGAIGGKAENYKAILETCGENEIIPEERTTPIVEVKVVDNSNLEKAMYEENRL